ncbi:MAG: hypothetical protein HC906_13980 [Bacteroidales bacterium]|nr:hypothetical protein [Bacteroidales bacterium]
MKRLLLIFSGLLFINHYSTVFAQETELDKLLKVEVENINPVYKPVMGFWCWCTKLFW